MLNRGAPPHRHQIAELVDLVDTRFSDPSPAVRITGVEPLGRLADLSPAHRRACARVLCAALRAGPDPGDAEQDDQPPAGETELQRALLAVLKARLTSTDPQTTWSALALDLSGIWLAGGDLAGIRLTGGSLRLSRSRIAGPLDLAGAVIERGGAILLDRTTITGRVVLDRLTLTDGQVVLDHARLEGGEVSIEDASLTGGHLIATETQLPSGRLSLGRSTIDGTMVTFHGSTLSGAALVLDGARISSGRCYLTSLMLTGGSISFRDAAIARPLLSLRMSTLAGGRFDLTGVQPIETAEADGGPDCFEGVYLIPPVDVRWGPWPEAEATTLDLREADDDPTGWSATRPTAPVTRTSRS